MSCWLGDIMTKVRAALYLSGPNHLSDGVLFVKFTFELTVFLVTFLVQILIKRMKLQQNYSDKHQPEDVDVRIMSEQAGINLRSRK